MPFNAEAAADVERDATHMSFGKLKHGGRLTSYPMHNLSARPNRHRICSRIMQPDHATAFHGHGGIAMMIKASLQPMRCVCQRASDVAFAHGEATNEVSFKSFVNERCVRP
jgi:hypothetical protein